MALTPTFGSSPFLPHGESFCLRGQSDPPMIPIDACDATPECWLPRGTLPVSFNPHKERPPAGEKRTSPTLN
jgi:hypothetical protein